MSIQMGLLGDLVFRTSASDRGPDTCRWQWLCDAGRVNGIGRSAQENPTCVVGSSFGVDGMRRDRITTRRGTCSGGGAVSPRPTTSTTWLDQLIAWEERRSNHLLTSRGGRWRCWRGAFVPSRAWVERLTGPSGSDPKLRDLHQLAILQGRLVSHDAGDGHVQGLGDVHQRLAVLEDRRDEFIHEVTV